MSSLPPKRGHILHLLASIQTEATEAKSFPSPATIFAVTDHVKWARAIARGVRKAFNFVTGSQEEQDLESTAYLTIVEMAHKFDLARVPPGGNVSDAFRGWAAIEVRCRCRREARRLRNGGTYHTRREQTGQALVVEPLRNETDLVDHRSEDEAEPDEREEESDF